MGGECGQLPSFIQWGFLGGVPGLPTQSDAIPPHHVTLPGGPHSPLILVRTGPLPVPLGPCLHL